MNFLRNLLPILLIVNTLFAFYIVFSRQRSIATTLAWLIVLLVFPGIGLIAYGFFGRGLAQENLFAINQQQHVGLAEVKAMLPGAVTEPGSNDTSAKAQNLIDYFNSENDSPITRDNHIKIYTDGQKKFAALFKDVRAAAETINVEYYTFYNDEIGNQFLDLLIQKAVAGVKVRLIYDPWGSAGASKRWFKSLVKVGGEVLPFVTSKNVIQKFRLNYHLHRKIVVIDGKIAWTGGFNVGDQYLGRFKKFGYWRDTHVRIIGASALVLQERFILDWNASINHPDQAMAFDPKYFHIPDPSLNHGIAAQIVSDGPDSDEQFLKNGMMKMMMMAKKRLWIQTPYLIPDDAMIAAWTIAATSGVDVRIMIPKMPDHPFIYRATQFYANMLTQYGIKIYIYENGFLHAKTTVVDERYGTIGTMNQDFRSYMLNFEVNAIFYDRKVNEELAKIFEQDMKKATLLTQDMIAQQSRWLRFKQQFSRLLSPIL